jgi:hypothetical protein
MTYYKQGLRKLARHKPQASLRFFDAAVSLCPAQSASRLARILFCAGAALRKLGVHDGAVHSWLVAHRLSKTSAVIHYLKWFANEYGMARHDFADVDDWRAFYAIQLRRYLSVKSSHVLESSAEGDMLRDLIYEAWEALQGAGSLEGKSAAEKIALFEATAIVFPVLLPCGAASHSLSGESLCPCGSGKPRKTCCGIAGPPQPSAIGCF